MKCYIFPFSFDWSGFSPWCLFSVNFISVCLQTVKRAVMLLGPQREKEKDWYNYLLCVLSFNVNWFSVFYLTCFNALKNRAHPRNQTYYVMILYLKWRFEPRIMNFCTFATRTWVEVRKTISYCPNCGPPTCFCGPWTFFVIWEKHCKNEMHVKIFKNVQFFSP